MFIRTFGFDDDLAEVSARFVNLSFQILRSGLSIKRYIAEKSRPPAPLVSPRNRWFADSPLEGTGFELPVRGRGQSGCRPFCAAECSGRVGAPSQFSDSTTPCIKAAWTRPPRPQSVPATHSAEFCLVREENGNALPGDRARRSRPGARQPLGRSEGAAAGPPSMRRAAMRAAAVKCWTAAVDGGYAMATEQRSFA